MSNPENSSALSAHPIVSKMIKGISASAPPKTIRAIWNVSDLCSWISNNLPSHLSYFEVARHLALLLLLLSGRRVHDLTLLRMDPPNLQRSSEGIVFWPVFGSKSDSSSFQQSGWQFSSLTTSNTWNVAYWVDIHLDLRCSRCGSLNLNSLFITSRGVVKPASRAVIAGWIATAMRLAGIPFSAGSIRSAVSSLARENLPLDVILSRGNWKSLDTFLKHYYKPLSSNLTPAEPPDISNNFRSIS